MAGQPTKKTTAKRKRTKKSPREAKEKPEHRVGPAISAGQTPLSADELLKSANTASATARNAWLAFLVLIAYLLVTIAGVTHTELLLNSPIKLPIVNVEIPLFSFFWVAPFLLLLVHLGLLMQHAMLAHKFALFSDVISARETGNSRDHPDRRQVNSYVFAYLLAGPMPPRVLGYLMRLMVFVTLSLLPVLVLLYFQVKFLPYHDVAATHAHRLAILLDLILLFSVRPFIAMPYLRPTGRKLRLGSERWPWEVSYGKLGVSAALYLAVLGFSVLVATVPQGCFWPFGTQKDDCFSLDRLTARWVPAWFARNIVVTEKDLVPDKDDEFGEVSISLRDRDLRFAVLNRSDLHRADLTGVDLRGAILVATRLEKARLERAQLQGADLRLAQLQGANLEGAELQGVYLRLAQLQGAALARANLQGANLEGADLQGVYLGSAQLQGANLVVAGLEGAYLGLAQLQGADLEFAQLEGAYLGFAQLQGADIGFARIWQTSPPREQGLRLADLTDAKIAPLMDGEREFLQKLIAESKDKDWGARLDAALAPLLIGDEDAKSWNSSAELQAWVAPRPDPAALSDFLAILACGDDASGYIAKGIARRGLSPLYNGDPKLLARRLSKNACAGSKTLDRDTKAMLCQLAAWKKNEIEQTFCAP